MPEQKPLVVVTRQLPEAVERRLAERFDARLNPHDVPPDPAALAAALGEADVLVASITDRLDAAMLDHSGPRLKLIANFGAGVDHIDVEAAHARGIAVTNTPGVLTDDTADIAMALILALPRRIPEGARLIPEGGDWPGWHPMWMIGEALGGKKLGLVGMGRIGQATAARARAFGMDIHYHNRRPLPAETEAALSATYWENLDAMLAAMDVVSLHCPATPATYHLLSARRLALMKPTAYLVNTARGGIIDEAALCDLLEASALGGAGLDVFEGEPHLNPRLIPLARAGKAMLLPHMGSGTIEARVRMGERVFDNIAAFAAGTRLPNQVIPAVPT